LIGQYGFGTFVKVFGEAGKHARAAVSVAGLPRNATVEIQLTAEL
jgi:enamine deaminase RidA (YjgF/YER057c/UK114 family)